MQMNFKLQFNGYLGYNFNIKIPFAEKQFHNSPQANNIQYVEHQNIGSLDNIIQKLKIQISHITSEDCLGEHNKRFCFVAQFVFVLSNGQNDTICLVIIPCDIGGTC